MITFIRLSLFAIVIALLGSCSLKKDDKIASRTSKTDSISAIKTDNSLNQNNKNTSEIIKKEILTFSNMGVPYLPELSGDSLYWVILKKGVAVVPPLIELVNDTTQTKVINMYMGDDCKVGDIAANMLGHIVMEMKLDLIPASNGMTPATYLNEYSHRLKYQDILREWYKKNKGNLIWLKDENLYRTAKDWRFKTNKNPTGGIYHLNKDSVYYFHL